MSEKASTGERSRPATTSSQVSRHTTATATGGASREASRAPTAVTAPGGNSGSVILENKDVDLLARGGTIYTGPDGQRPYRMAVKADFMFTGEGDRSMEDTSGVSYLFRGPRDAPFPKAKAACIGEIGWSAKSLAST